ncbi:alkaline phosphatase family protein [bacterium]|nr:alkaline phosphatase family protein [bacterium]
MGAPIIPDRLLVLGLDGLDLDAPGEAALAHMPRLSALLVENRAVRFPTALPNNSIACWTSWFCGRGPGAHGMVDFVLPLDRTGTYRLTSSADRVAPALWEELSARGRRVVVYNVPGTYPATPVNGIMIAGAPVLSRRHLTFPDYLPPRIARRLDGYRDDLKFEVAGSDEDSCLAAASNMSQILSEHVEIASGLLAEPWDAFIAVLTMTDRLLHHFHHRLAPCTDDTKPCLCARAVADALARLDDFVGALVDEWRGKARIVLASDHGFQPCSWRWHWADALEKEGWFVRRADGTPASGDAIDVARADTERSLLWPSPASTMGLTFAPRVTAGERKRLAREIAARFSDVTAPDHETAVERVIDVDDIAAGPLRARFPDLLVVPRNGAIALTSRPGRTAFSPSPRSGTHTLYASCAIVGGKPDVALGFGNLFAAANLPAPGSA